MMSTLSRAAIDALLPEGPFWEPESGNDYDKLLDGIAANSEAVRLVLDKLRYLRNPYQTPILSDLEKEYGIIPSATATDAERRQRLASKMFRRNEQPTYERLEEALRIAGFDVYVHQNSPAVDPNNFLDENFQMYCGDTLPGGNDAQCGEPEAYCARTGGELLVNGEFYRHVFSYNMLCGDSFFWYNPQTHTYDIEGDQEQCGEPTAVCGQYNAVSALLKSYNVPDDPGYWPLIFFVGGEATRDPVTGEITQIEIASIPTERRLEFRRIILKYKPMMSWGALIVVYQ